MPWFVDSDQDGKDWRQTLKNHLKSIMTQSDKIIDRSQAPFIMLDHRILETPLTMEAFRVYAELKKHADRLSGECFPSYLRLGKRCFSASYPSCHEQTLRKKAMEAVKELISWGLLYKEERFVNRAEASDCNVSNLYILTPPEKWLRSPLEISTLIRKPGNKPKRKKNAQDVDTQRVVGDLDGSGGGVPPALPQEVIEISLGGVPPTLPGVRPEPPGVPPTLIELDPGNYNQLTRSTHKSEENFCVCEPPEDALQSFPEPEEEAPSDEKLKQVADRSTNVEDKSENPRVANKSTHEDNSSAAAQSSEKANNGNCWQCPQPELRVEFLKWRAQNMGKGATITKASNWCNKYPQSANDSFVEFLESRQPSETQTLPDSALQAFLTGCGDKLRAIVLNNDFSPEQLTYIAESWEASGRREGLTILFLKKEGVLS